MKKILTLIIACLMITSLTACSNDKKTETPVEEETVTKDFLVEETQISKKQNDITEETVLTIDMNNTNLSFFTIYGKAETLPEPISYSGIYAANKLLISEKTLISFTTTKKMTLTVYTVESDNKKINIDNKDYVIENGSVSVDIEAGEHTILPNESFITCLFVKEFSDRISLNFSPDHSIGFDTTGVEISQKDGKTTYTFTSSGAVIEKLDNEEYAKIITPGTDEFLKEVLENLSTPKEEISTEEIVGSTEGLDENTAETEIKE